MLNGLFKAKAIKGGVHLHAYRKEDSATLPIIAAGIPPFLYLPLRQHAGSDAQPVVKVGEQVGKGQLLAQAGSEVSAPIHAPTSGVITDLTDIVAPHPSGLKTRAFILRSDGADQWYRPPAPTNPFAEERTGLAEQVAQAGIVGLGGAIFPAAVKLKQGVKHEIKTVIINGSECEPYLTCDDRLMRERAETVVEGARLIQYILNAWRVVIAIEDNKPEAIAAVRAAAGGHGAVEVKVVPTRYPMGSAKQLIQAVIGREVPAGGRSTDVGVLVHNVGTAYAIAEALTLGKPLISRIVTVAGAHVRTPRNVEVLIGTPIAQVLEVCGGLTGEPQRLVMGGPMMGVSLPTREAPIIKGATGILALGHQQLPESAAEPCVRCTRCVSACPMGLLPLEMARHSRAEDFEGANDAGLTDCILCGSCSYVCPSHIPLVQYFQYAKGELDARKTAAGKLAYTQALAARREERKQAEARAKAEAKAAKKRKAGKTAAPTVEPGETP